MLLQVAYQIAFQKSKFVWVNGKNASKLSKFNVVFVPAATIRKQVATKCICISTCGRTCMFKYDHEQCVYKHFNDCKQSFITKIVLCDFSVQETAICQYDWTIMSSIITWIWKHKGIQQFFSWPVPCLFSESTFVSSCSIPVQGPLFWRHLRC